MGRLAGETCVQSSSDGGEPFKKSSEGRAKFMTTRSHITLRACVNSTFFVLCLPHFTAGGVKPSGGDIERNVNSLACISCPWRPNTWEKVASWLQQVSVSSMAAAAVATRERGRRVTSGWGGKKESGEGGKKGRKGAYLPKQRPLPTRCRWGSRRSPVSSQRCEQEVLAVQMMGIRREDGGEVVGKGRGWGRWCQWESAFLYEEGIDASGGGLKHGNQCFWMIISYRQSVKFHVCV